MLTVLGAVVVTAAVLLFDWNSSPASNREFVKSIRFLIWAVFLCAQSAIWAAVALPVSTTVRRLHRHYSVSRALVGRLAASTAVIVALVVAFEILYGPAVPDYPFAHHFAKLIALTVAGLVVALLAVIGMWLVEAASGQLQKTRPEAQLREYLRLRGDLRGFLAAAPRSSVRPR